MIVKEQVCAERGGWPTQGRVALVLAGMLAVAVPGGWPLPAMADYAVDFEGAGETDTSYNVSTRSLSGLNWAIGPQALIGTDANDMRNGARAARLRLDSSVYGAITMSEDKANGVGTISFVYARADFSNDRTGTAPSFVVEYSTNAGSDWTQAGSIMSLEGVDTLTSFSHAVNVEGNVRVRIRQTAGATGKRWNVDDILLTDHLEPAPDAPVALPASSTNVQGFTAAWETVADVTGYRLDVATRSEFLPVGSTLLTNDFEDIGWPPPGWITNSVDQSSAQKRSGSYSALLNATNDYLVTPLLDRPATLRFWSYRTAATPTLIVEQSASTNGPWAAMAGSPFEGTEGQFVGWECGLGNTTGVYVRFRKTGSSGNVYVDDVHVLSAQGDFVPGYENRVVAGETTVSAVVTGLVSGTDYYYRVRAAGESTASADSTTQNVQTLGMPAPSTLAATAVGALEFDANWNALAEATGYRLDVSTSTLFPTFVPGFGNRDVGNVTTITVTGLLAQTAYHYRVRAYDAGSTSAHSDTRALSTLLKGEPSDHAAGFAAPTVTHRTIVLNWTDAGGDTPPDGYLVRGSTNGFEAIPTPVDGGSVTLNTGWTGGLYANRVNPGVQTDTLTGLSAGQVYFLKLFPYSNSGSQTDYKTNDIVPAVSAQTGVAPFEDFEGLTLLTYTTNTLALGSGDWLFSNAMLGQTAPDKRQDQRAARIQGNGFLEMQFDITRVNTLSLEHADFSADSGGRFVLEMSEDGGASWQPVGNEVHCSDSLQTESFTVNRPGAIRFRIVQTAGGRLNIDNVRLTLIPRAGVFRFR